MEYRKVGSAGIKISTVSLGAWLTYGARGSVEEDIATQCIHTAIESGINFIDVADVYAGGDAEITVGQAIKPFERHKLVISTKCYHPMSDDVNDRGLSRKHVIESVHGSLRRFDMDYVDILFCHRFDPDTPLEETVGAIGDMIAQGKVFYWGTSMWTGAQIERGVAVSDALGVPRPIVEQPKYNMLDRTIVEGQLEASVDFIDMGLVVFSPLAGGMLTGKYNDGIPEGSRATTNGGEGFKSQVADEERLQIVRNLTAFANDELGVEVGALALAWAMAHRNVDSVITGASKVSHVERNLKALDIDITADIGQKIEEILGNRPADSRR